MPVDIVMEGNVGDEHVMICVDVVARSRPMGCIISSTPMTRHRMRRIIVRW